MYPFVVFINKCMQGLFYEKVSLISEIPHQHPYWYFKPIKFGHLLILLTSEETNFNPKKFKSRHFLSSIHISLYSPSSHSLSLFACCLSLSLPVLSLSLHVVSLSLSSRSLCVLSPAPSGAAVRIASLSLARPHLRLSHCCTTFSNPTPPEYHCPTLIFGDPISNSGFTSWVFLLFFSLFFCLFLFFEYLFDLVLFFGCVGVFLFKTKH